MGSLCLNNHLNFKKIHLNVLQDAGFDIYTAFIKS